MHDGYKFDDAIRLMVTRNSGVVGAGLAPALTELETARIVIGNVD